MDPSAEHVEPKEPTVSTPVRRRSLWISGILTAAVVLILSGIYVGNLDDLSSEATYGNFDRRGSESFVHRLLPGLIDTARGQFYEFTREVHWPPLVIIGSVFVIFWAVRTVGIRLWDLRRAAVQWTVFVVTRLGVLRVGQVFPVRRAGLGCFPFLTCEACEMATGACPAGTAQISLSRGRLPLLSLGVMMAGGVLLARTLCGWACPMGLFLDMAGRFLGRRTPMPRVLAALKFAVLGLTLLSVGVIGLLGLGTVLPFCSTLCLGGVIYGLIPYYATTAKGGYAHLLPAGITLILFHTAVLVLFIQLSRTYTARFFCRSVCPVGAFLGLFNRISLVQVVHRSDACTGCGACQKACPMDIDLSSKDFLTDSNCIRCGICVRTCPSEARTWSFQQGDSREPGLVSKDINST
jgi:ferredoxin